MGKGLLTPSVVLTEEMGPTINRPKANKSRIKPLRRQTAEILSMPLVFFSVLHLRCDNRTP